MKKCISLVKLVSILACLGIFIAGTAFAAPPVQENHEIVVSADGTGDFETVTAAVYSITDSSETNRYLIRIEPGTYNCYFDLQPGQDYISFSGAGVDVTICSPGHLTGMKKSNISNMTISGSSGPIVMSSSVGPEDKFVAVDNVKITGGYYLFYGEGKIMNSTLIGSNTGPTTATVAGSSVLVENSYIEGNNTAIWNLGSITLRDSEVYSASGSIVNFASGTLNVYNSVLTGADLLSGTNGTFSAAGSQLAATLNLRPGVDKIVNCFDAGFNPIANQ